MKKSFLFTFLSILIFSFTAQAQDNNRYSSSQLDNLANELKRTSVDLADRTSDDLRRSYTRSRADLETAFLAQQLDASVGLFQQIIRSNNNRASDLRDSAAILSDLIRRAPSYGSNSNLWRNAQNLLNDINREIGGGYGGGGYGGGNDDNNNNNPVIGRVFWSGFVDDRVRISIRGSRLDVDTISGTAYAQGNYNFTSSLPRRNVTVGVDKKRGRGSARVIQQPSRENDYTAVIEVRDEDGGAKDYQLDIFWRQ